MEFFGKLIGECSGNPSGGGTGCAFSILSELIDSPLAVFFGAYNDDFSGVGNGGDDPGGEFDSVISFVDIEDVVADGILLLYVSFHVVIDFACSKMNLNLGRQIPSQKAV